jgi:hypothetical protein
VSLTKEEDKMKKVLLITVALLVCASAVLAGSASLSPVRQLRVDGWGGVVDNAMVAWADGGEYRVCAEFDISPYIGNIISNATLSFSAQAIWAGGYKLDVDQIQSDLWIDQSDFAFPSLANVTQSHWNNGGMFFDVTPLVAAALPSSYPNPGYYPWGKGIQFRWSDNSGQQLTYGYVVSGVNLSFDYAPVPEPGSLLALGSGLVALAGMVIRRRA